MNEPLTIRAIKGGKAHAVETFAAFPVTREIVADEFDEDTPPGGGDSHAVNPVVGSPDTDEAAGAIYPTVPAVKRASPEKVDIRENTARTFHATPGGNEDRGGSAGKFPESLRLSVRRR